jgi:antitoxin HicB
MKNVEELMNLDYRISLQKDEDGGYVAAVDELPGCIADGRTPNKAVENLREAMKSWMSSRAEAGLDIPEPRGISDYSGKILVRMPKSLHKKLSTQAAAEGVSLNQHVVSTLSEAWGKAFAVEFHAAAASATYVGVTNAANCWTGFATPGHYAKSVFAHNTDQFAYSGTYVLAGTNMSCASQEPATVTYAVDQDELQRRPRRVQAA